MKKIFKFIYKIIIALIERRKHVRISLLSHFNPQTKFEGYNVIWEGAVVSNSHIGKGTYIGTNSRLTNCYIGRFCSIAADVSVITGNHPSNFISTSPSFFSLLKQNGLIYTDKQKFDEILPQTKICNDVWIGEGGIIMGGTTIGDGAIIGAGAVVVKDVPPYAVVGGVPAKVIKYRFEQPVIDKLLELKWWNASDEKLKNNISYFQSEDITTEMLNELEIKLKS